MANGQATGGAPLPLQPQSMSSVPSAQPGSPEFENNKSQWLQVLSSPNVRAGLLQFGLQALQPVPVGQSGFGALAGAVGSGVEASDRVTAQEQAQTERLTREAEAARRLALEDERLDVTRRGQDLQSGLGQDQISAQMGRLDREYQLRERLALLPPNQQSLLLKSYLEALQNAPFYGLQPGTPEYEQWADQTFLDLENRIKQTQSLGVPGVPGVPGAPAPAPVPGTDVPQPAPSPQSTVPIPPNLAGRSLQRNDAMQLFRDKNTNELFNFNGEPVASQQ